MSQPLKNLLGRFKNEEASGEEVCLINIGPKERRHRMIFGIVGYVFSGIIAAVLVATRVNRLWRITLFLPFLMGGFGVFQATGKT